MQLGRDLVPLGVDRGQPRVAQLAPAGRPQQRRPGNQTTGKIVLWYMDAAVVRTTGLFTTPASVGNNNWRVVAVGDFGKGPAQTGTPVLGTQDIVWQNDTSLKMVVWHMDHATQRTGGAFTTPDSLPLPGFVLVGPR